MEINKINRKTTLKAVFIKYLATLIIVFAIIASIIMLLVSIGLKYEFLIPANHVENIIKQMKPVLINAKEITEEMIPQGCRYTILDKELNIKKTNMNEENLKQSILFAKNKLDKYLGSSKRYYLIENGDEICVLQYYVQLNYNSEWLNEHFPKPEILLIISFGVVCLIAVIFITLIFAKNLKVSLEPLLVATKKIKEQDLNFDTGSSKIEEFDNILISLSDMKTELKKSLENQWNFEQSKREQISALAHDLKTPLTVAKGNAELLKETKLDNEQKEYMDYILKKIQQIEQYIILLNRLSNIDLGISFSLNNINTEEFIKDITKELIVLATPKDIEVVHKNENLPQLLTIDKDLFYRCLMNIVSNAVNYTPVGGKIIFKAVGEEDCLKFIIIDSGKGFTREDIKFAKKQFYMSDLSRSSSQHYGLGLYIADSIVKKHNGKLIIENSKGHGGKVVITIPIV
ncbi:HAMP domain-containing sensor histidine kinase [Clostridiaceae bacterium M8S5]|nr:HAMP domain-containing sensor histidine kinase [Clostridiaceae bacterium M8S5]